MARKSSSKEPSRLLEGKAFQRRIQEDWQKTAEGEITAEKTVTKPSGRKGRIDVHAITGGEESLAAVVEVKASDWDRMTDRALRRNIHRQAKQIWDYIEAELAAGNEVSPGVVFPKRPAKVERLKLIEALFEAEGISVVWDDESLAECREGKQTE